MKKTKIKKDLFNRIKEIGSENKVRGITLISLVITIIVLLILAGITIITLTSENGLLSKSSQASIETEQKNAREKLTIKVTTAQMKSYAETQQMPTLQYLADCLCEDDEIDYVKTESSKTASLEKIQIGDAKSIYTKLKDYTYEFEINENFELASIDGVKLAKTGDDDNTGSGLFGNSSLIPDFEIKTDKVLRI